MLTVKNGNITVTRGETCLLQYVGMRRNGMPLILAPQIDYGAEIAERQDYAILALTVRSGAYGDILLAKYLDLETEPMFGGKTDTTPGGYHKFKTTNIVPVTSLSEVTDERQVYTFDNGFVTLCRAMDGTMFIANYAFKLAIPFSWSELQKLQPGVYVYDINLYYGTLVKPEGFLDLNTFPLKEDKTLVKIPLVKLHKFTVEDSNNV